MSGRYGSGCSGDAEACSGEVGNGDGDQRAVTCQAASNSSGDVNIINVPR